MSRLYFIILAFFLTACTSYQQFQYLTQGQELPYKIFKSSYNEAWSAVTAVMKSSNYNLEELKIESGVMKTFWIDNTLELNFADSFGSSDSIKQAKFKLVVNVIKGNRAGREVAKVVVYKRQLVKNDFLQGWRQVYQDQILEKTMLYRVGRELAINQRLKKIETMKANEAEDAF